MDLLLGSLDIATNNLLVSVNQREQLLLGFLESTLESLNILGGRLATGELVLRRRAWGLVHQDELRGLGITLRENQVHTNILPQTLGSTLTQVLVVERVDIQVAEPARRVAANEVHDIHTSLHAVLGVPRVDLPSSRAIVRRRKHNAGVMHALELGNSLALPQVASQVTSVGMRVGVLAGNVDVGALHRGSQIHDLVDTAVNLVGRSNNGKQLRVIVIRRQNDGTSGLGEEVMQGATALANDELMPTTLNGHLVHGELATELLDLALNLGAGLVGSVAITGDGDGVGGLGSEGNRLAAGSRLRGSPLSPGEVMRNLDANVTAILVRVDARVVGTSQEGVVLGRDVLQAEVDAGSALVDNALNLLLGQRSCDSITLNDNVDGSAVIILESASLLLLGNLNTCAGALADTLDSSTLATNDVGADRSGDSDLGGLLDSVSQVLFPAPFLRHTLEPSSLATSLRAERTASTGPVP